MVWPFDTNSVEHPSHELPRMKSVKCDNSLRWFAVQSMNRCYRFAYNIKITWFFLPPHEIDTHTLMSSKKNTNEMIFTGIRVAIAFVCWYDSEIEWRQMASPKINVTKVNEKQSFRVSSTFFQLVGMV